MEPTFSCDICGQAMAAGAVLSHMETHVAREVEVPDVVGEIVGWRAWRVSTTRLTRSLDAVDYALLSATNGSVWPKKRWLHATCAVGFGHAEKVPAAKCSCGIYAAKNREHLVSMHYHRYQEDDDVVIGEVALAGKVIPGTQGWRAEKARPLRLHVPYTRWRLVEPLALAYGVEVVLDNTLQADEEEEDD